MVRKFDLLVFDWDGTLFDSTASIIRSIQAACRDLGLEEPSDRQAGHVIGLGLSEALSYVAPDLADERLPLLVDRYRHHYLSSDQDIRLFEGVADMIENLHASGYCLAVATGKSRKGLDRALASSGLGRFFSSSRCADECISKPHPQMLAELMAEFGIEETRTLMIGDTTHDLQMAINAQVPGLAVSYGAHSGESLRSLNPLGCLESVERLRQWLDSNA